MFADIEVNERTAWETGPGSTCSEPTTTADRANSTCWGARDRPDRDGFFTIFDERHGLCVLPRLSPSAVRDLGLEIRAGCHTGEIELAGNGAKGIAVHIGARILALAEPSPSAGLSDS